MNLFLSAQYQIHDRRRFCSLTHMCLRESPFNSPIEFTVFRAKVLMQIVRCLPHESWHSFRSLLRYVSSCIPWCFFSYPVVPSGNGSPASISLGRILLLPIRRNDRQCCPHIWHNCLRCSWMLKHDRCIRQEDFFAIDFFVPFDGKPLSFKVCRPEIWIAMPKVGDTRQSKYNDLLLHQLAELW